MQRSGLLFRVCCQSGSAHMINRKEKGRSLVSSTLASQFKMSVGPCAESWQGSPGRPQRETGDIPVLYIFGTITRAVRRADLVHAPCRKVIFSRAAAKCRIGQGFIVVPRCDWHFTHCPKSCRVTSVPSTNQFRPLPAL